MSEKNNKKEKYPDDNFEKNEEKKEIFYGVKEFFVEMIKIFALAIIVIVPVRMFLFQPFFVQGASMEPNFEDGQYLIVNELGYKKTDLGIVNVEPFKEMKRGDVVVFRYPRNPKLFFIKRIIGLPGEKIEIRNEKVYIFNDKNPNGMELAENYLPENLPTNGNVDYKIKKNEYYVMGDNRMHSSDSRAWGPIRESDVIGRVVLRAWPINKMSLFIN